MAEKSNRHGRRAGFEENTMALLESSSIKDSNDLIDDRICFLEAVRTAALFDETPCLPSWRMYNAMFGILLDSKSLELLMSCYRLLIDLDKRYPRVYIANCDKDETSSGGAREIVVDKEVWSPFAIGGDAGKADMEGVARSSDRLFDSMSVFVLIEKMSQAVDEMHHEITIQPLENMVLLLYLISVLEADFSARLTLYRETRNWGLLRESIINTLLGTRKMNAKVFFRNCFLIFLKQCHYETANSLQDSSNLKGSSIAYQDSKSALAITLPEVEKEACKGLQRLFNLVIELDMARKEADLHSSTSRAEGLRVDIFDIIVDELTYNRDYASSILMVFSEPKWKLEFVLQYLSQYYTKTSVRTRRSSESIDCATLGGILNYFSTAANAKTIVRKVTSEVTQLLLAHGFQAYLSVLHNPLYLAYLSEKIGGSLDQICESFLSAFKTLKTADKNFEISTFGKEALFTAATVLSRKSSS